MKNGSDSEDIRDNLRDDIRAFLLKRLAWNRLTDAQRAHIRALGEDRALRRPSFLAIEQTVDDVPLEARVGKCHVGAEGAMTHVDEGCVHLAFKCGNPQHPFHYSALGVETVVLLAKACEATWPGVISRNLRHLPGRSEELNGADRDDDRLILDPGDDTVDLNAPDDTDAVEDHDCHDGSGCRPDED